MGASLAALLHIAAVLLFVLALPLGALVRDSLTRSALQERLLFHGEGPETVRTAEVDIPELTRRLEEGVLAPSWPAGIRVTVPF